MADTTYVDGSTLLTADTMNDLNRLHYTILSDPADAPAVRTALGLATADSPQFTAVNVGHATDTTITRVSAGVIAVEGTNVLLNGGALGTPASGVLTNCTGTAAGLTAGAVAVGGITGLGTGVDTFLATPSSANLAAAVTGETGTGALVFATTPTLTTPVLGVATATSVNKVAITAPATSATLTIADGKTLTVSKTITLTGTDSSSYNLDTITTGGIVLGTPIATTSGTSAAYTGLPAGIRQIKFMLKGVSTAAVANSPEIQMGDATTGGYVTSGHLVNIDADGVSGTSSTSGVPLTPLGTGATNTMSGTVTFSLLDATAYIWAVEILLTDSSDNQCFWGSGHMVLAGAVDRIKIKIDTSTLDAGVVNIAYVL